jgi:Mg2+ transporter MgtE
MVFLSDVLNVTVRDNQGQTVGAVADIIVNVREAFPVVAALVVTPATGGRVSLPTRPAPLIIPWRQVVSIEEPRLRLNVARGQINAYTPHAGEIYLARDILDKQIVDTQGRRVVKVNDLKLAQVRGAARLLGADISFWAFFRRLLPFRFSERLVTWNYVQQVGQDPRDVHLRVPGTTLSDLHPADLADLIEDMHPDAGVALLNSLDVETAADALQEMEESYQAPMVESMTTEHASDLLEAMPPDEAADIIGDLSDDKAEEILANMEPEPAQEVKALLRYEENTAGGRMTPDVFTLHPDMTAQQAINAVRSAGPPPETTYYLFVVTKTGELVGVVSLRALISAQPATTIVHIMQKDVTAVHVNDDQSAVAAVIRKYNLLGVPVVDDQRRLLGMVTVDNVLDVMQEEREEDMSRAVGAVNEDITPRATPLDVVRGRIAWLSASLLGGLIAGVILSLFSLSISTTLSLVYFVPLIVAIGHVIGAQSFVVTERADPADVRREVWRQTIIGVIVGAVAGFAVAILAYLWLGDAAVATAIGVSLAATMIAAAILGALSPFILHRFGMPLSFAGGPMIDALNSVISVLLYMVLATAVLARLR